MSNYRGEDLARSLGFMGIIRFPITLVKYIVGGIKSTVSSKHKQTIKRLQKDSLEQSFSDASTSSDYYTTSGYSTIPSPAKGASNLKKLVNNMMSQMISDGWSYDFAGLANYNAQMAKVRKKPFMKSSQALSYAEVIYHKKNFSLKKTFSTLSGCCQDLSTILAISLASQLEQKGFADKISGKTRVQDLLDEDETGFLSTLPPDRKIKLVFGEKRNLSTGKKDKHAIIEIDYTDPSTKKKETRVVDPAQILAQPSYTQKKAIQSKFCFVTQTEYAQNLKTFSSETFKPTTEIEIKPQASIEQIYKDLYDTSRIYPESKAYISRQR